MNRSADPRTHVPAAHLPARLLARWINGARHHAWLVIVLVLAATVAILDYTLSNLGMNTDTTDMIAEDLPFRQAMKDFDREFPQFVDLLVVVIDGDTPDLAEDAAAALAARLERESAAFKTVYRPGGEAFLVRHGLLYLDTDKLDELADNLARMQPLLAALAEDTSLRRLFAELETAVGELRGGADPSFDPGDAFDHLADAVEATLDGLPYRLSWQEVISGGEPTIADRRRLVLAQPRLDFSELLPQRAAIETVRRLADELALVPGNGVRVRLTGSVALNHDQLMSAQRGAQTAALLSLGLVTAVLLIGLRSLRLVFAAFITLIAGLIWTAGFATAAIGELNLISVAFAVLFIGLGIDFSIHLCLRYQELVESEGAEALARAGSEVGRALFLCAATTAAGFYVFIPTDYAGVSELGLIAGTGVFISLFANLTVLPALLELMPLRAGANPPRQPRDRPLFGFDGPRRRTTVRFGALALAVIALVLLPQVRFDFNPLNLHDPKAESVTTLRDLLADAEDSPWSLDVLTADLDTAEAMAAEIESIGEVGKTVTLADYVPDNQDDKLDLIEEMAFFMGLPSVPEGIRPSADDDGRRAALHGLRAALDDWIASGPIPGAIEPTVRRLASDLDRLEASDMPLDGLERSLLAALPERLRRLSSALEVAAPVTIGDLPETLVERMVARDGRFRVRVFPRDDLADNRALRHFVEAVRRVAPDAIGNPVSIVEAGDAVIHAFIQALASALAVIVGLLFVLTRRVDDTALVLAPLLLAAALTGAASVIINIPFNFANVIVLPLLLGVGVDSAIHLVHRRRIDPLASADLLRTSTARGVVLSALTTIGSFGSLIVSSHRGTATMGALLTIGVGITLITTLVFLPALAPSRRQDRETGAMD